VTNAASGTLVEPVAGGRPVRRAVAVVVLGSSVAAGAAAITLLSRILRSVTAVGGSCADGAPYVLAQPCPSGTGTALLFLFPCALLCLVGGLWGASVLEAPPALWLGWPALFLTLGWNFLEDGFDPPMGGSIAVGYVVCGVVFVLMGAGPLLFWRSIARGSRRTPATVPPRRADDDPASSAMSVAGHAGRGGHAARAGGPGSEPEQPRRTTGWWLYYLLAAALGVYGGLQLFDWVTT